MIRNMIQILTDSEVERLHNESMQVLERMGIKLPNVEALELCRKAGAVVDRDREIIRIPRKVIEEALAACRPTDPLPRDPIRNLMGGISTQVFITLEHMRANYWEAPSRAFWRDQWETWKHRGGKIIYDRAHEYVEKVSAGYRDAEVVISPTQAEEIDRIYEDTRMQLARERETS